MKKGQRVIVRNGGKAWDGHSGEYVCDEKTLIGILARVELDNGMATLTNHEYLEII